MSVYLLIGLRGPCGVRLIVTWNDECDNKDYFKNFGAKFLKRFPLFRPSSTGIDHALDEG